MSVTKTGDLPSRLHFLGGRTIEVLVRRSPRARHARVIVGPDRPVEVVLPRRMPQRRVAAILREKHDWIERQLERLEAREQREPVLGLDRPGVVWLHGEPVPIEVRVSNQTRNAGWTARLETDTLVISGPATGTTGVDETEAAVLRWYRREARQRINLHMASEAERIGVWPSRLTIRDPKTRWGSCSARATLSFSWRLLLAPFDVLDYVVVHELCHLRELNHSHAFWQLVQRVRPDYQEQYDWLREHGGELLDYRPAVAASQVQNASSAG